MQNETKLILNSIGFAVFDEMKHNKLNKHQALLAVLEIVDSPEDLKKQLN